MRTVKYRFMNEIQDRTAYTKQEVLDLLKYDYDYYHEMAIRAINKINKKDAEECLAEILEKLSDQLEDREYLDIEMYNICYAIEDQEDIVHSLKQYQPIW